MGLCKCPKKKVTNLFCFEHRVNVCEHCLVASHSACVVQSYLQWLQDSDYDPNCALCASPLPCGGADPSEGEETVRLQCLDVFHWRCLDEAARQLPHTTAPAGYVCPLCSKPVIPGPTHQGPVADALRRQLSRVNWARVGLGLPPVDEPSPQQAAPPPPQPPHSSVINVTDAPTDTHARGAGAVAAATSTTTQVPRRTLQEAVFSVPGGGDAGGSSSKRKGGAYAADADEDKYKRRGPLDFAARWLGTRGGAPGGQAGSMGSGQRRRRMLAVLAVLAFLTLVIVFTRLGHHVTDHDPFLDPMSNPNIRVADSN